MSTLWGLILACLLVACGKGDGASSPSSRAATADAPKGTPGGAGAGAADAGAPILSEAIRKAVCGAEPCGGEISSIDVYRDAGGSVKKLYRLHGRCFHSPGIYFDPDGTQTEIIPEKPIVPGSPEANAIQAKHDNQIGGLTKTDSIRCRDGRRSTP